MAAPNQRATTARPGEVICRHCKNPVPAFGAAADLRARTGRSAIRRLLRASNLRGRIAREHYVFAVKDADVIGDVGWALCDEAIAKAWSEQRHASRAIAGSA